MQVAEPEHVFKKQEETHFDYKEEWTEMARGKAEEYKVARIYTVFKTLKRSLGVPEQKGQPFKGTKQKGWHDLDFR